MLSKTISSQNNDNRANNIVAIRALGKAEEAVRKSDQAIKESDHAVGLISSIKQTIEDHVKASDYSMLVYPLAVFFLVLIYYVSMEARNIHANEYSRTGAFIVSGIGLIITIGYYLYKDQKKT